MLPLHSTVAIRHYAIGNSRYVYDSILMTCVENGHMILRKHHDLYQQMTANCNVFLRFWALR